MMNVFAVRTNLIRASNLAPYWPGANSIPSSFAMANGSTGRRHISKAISCFFASASISMGAAIFALAGFTLEDFPFPPFEFFGSFVIDFLCAIQTAVGPAAREGEILTLIRVGGFGLFP